MADKRRREPRPGVSNKKTTLLQPEPGSSEKYMREMIEYVPATWRTSNRVTEFFFENLPSEVWSKKIPGAPHRTIRMIAGHIHNARCSWIKMVGKQYGIKIPKSVDRRRVSQKPYSRP